MPKKHSLSISKSELKRWFPDLEGKISDGIEIVTGRHPKINYDDATYTINTQKSYSFLDSKTQALSFFSGAGGLDIGAQLADVKVIASSDFDADCIATLKENKIFSHSEHRLEDIAQVKAKDYSKILRLNNPEKLVIIGGPPCQPFSKAGYWVSNKNRLADKDPRNMIAQYLKLISEIKPDGFLLENVESIFHPSNRAVIEYINEKILKMGYSHEIVRANSLDYGAPQKRKRVFFVATKKKNVNGEPRRTHGSDSDRIIQPKLRQFEKVLNWIGKFDSPKFYEKEEVARNGTFYSDLSEVPPGKNYISLTSAAGYKNPKFIAQKRFWSFLLKLHPLQPSWTIAAQPGPWVGPFHWTSRRLRVPEIAAIQTFPEDYDFHGSRRSIQRQIGNAVPPLMGKAMVKFLASNL